MKKFADLIERMRFETRGLSLPDLVDKVINESGLVAHFQADKDGEDRVENLKELVNRGCFFFNCGRLLPRRCSHHGG